MAAVVYVYNPSMPFFRATPEHTPEHSCLRENLSLLSCNFSHPALVSPVYGAVQALKLLKISKKHIWSFINPLLRTPAHPKSCHTCLSVTKKDSLICFSDLTSISILNTQYTFCCEYSNPPEPLLPNKDHALPWT